MESNIPCTAPALISLAAPGTIWATLFIYPVARIGILPKLIPRNSAGNDLPRVCSAAFASCRYVFGLVTASAIGLANC